MNAESEDEWEIELLEALEMGNSRMFSFEALNSQKIYCRTAGYDWSMVSSGHLLVVLRCTQFVAHQYTNFSPSLSLYNSTKYRSYDPELKIWI